MTDPMQLLRASNPIHECDAPDFGRLLERLEHEPSEPQVPDPVVPTRGRLLGPRSKNLPRITTGRRILAVLLPVAVALAVTAVAIVSLHGSGAGSGPRHTTPATGSLAYPSGQAHGRVVPGSMHRFTAPASATGGVTWGAEWFRTTARQICVQAGRQVGGRLGYVDIDGIFPHDGRFRAWAPNTAVNARCVDQPARGGVALTVVERVADSGYVLAANGACTADEHVPCPATEMTTLFFGVVGSGAVMVNYGTERHSVQSLPAGPGADGEYLQEVPMTTRDCAVDVGECHARFPLPSSRAFVIYRGNDRPCVLSGLGTDGVLSGDCPYGLTIGPSPDRLTPAEVRAPVHVTTRVSRHQVQVAARFHTPVPSSRVSEYELQLSTPDRCPPSGAATGSSLPLRGFHAGQLLTIRGTVGDPCSGTYHGAVVVQPLVGSTITVAHFSFTEPRGR